MKLPTLAPHQLGRVKWWEYALRFAFGGAITLVASLVAKHWGSGAGGMFLAFPAIMPASLTLVKQHDGRSSAIEDARGGRIGAVALACFALVVAATATRIAPISVLVLAAIAWLVVAVAGWLVVDGRRG